MKILKLLLSDENLNFEESRLCRDVFNENTSSYIRNLIENTWQTLIISFLPYFLLVTHYRERCKLIGSGEFRSTLIHLIQDKA